MSILTVTAEQMLRRFPSGSIQRINMLRVVEISQIRFVCVRDILITFKTDTIPELKDRAIRRLLYKECDDDTKKSLKYIERQIRELEEIKEKLQE